MFVDSMFHQLSPGNKGRPLLHSTSSIVAKAHTAIVQLDCIGDKLLVSTLTKCAIVDLKRFVCCFVVLSGLSTKQSQELLD